MSSRRRLLSLLFALLSFAPAGGALAQELSLEQMEEARESYRTGADAYKARDFAAAEKGFRRCYELMQSPSVLFDLGLALERQRKWRAAADTFEAYMHDARAKVKNPRKLEKHIAALRLRAQRQESLRDVERPKVRDQGEPEQPGNEVLPMAEPGTEDPLLGVAGEGSVEDRQAAAAAPVTPPPAEVRPAKKSKWWVWPVVGGAAALVAGVGIGVGVGMASREPGPFDVPDIGPGAGALLHF